MIYSPESPQSLIPKSKNPINLSLGGLFTGVHPHLGGHVDVGCLLQQQGRHVAVALLRGQVQGGDSLSGQDVGLGPILQQGGGYVHLVLLGRNVERGVAILVRVCRGGQVLPKSLNSLALE